MAKKTQVYDDNSIKLLKGADRVRKRPAVIFGSDGLEGCEHSVFEILSNAVDEAREGHGDRIHITATRDGVITIVRISKYCWRERVSISLNAFVRFS